MKEYLLRLEWRQFGRASSAQVRYAGDSQRNTISCNPSCPGLGTVFTNLDIALLAAEYLVMFISALLHTLVELLTVPEWRTAASLESV